MNPVNPVDPTVSDPFPVAREAVLVAIAVAFVETALAVGLGLRVPWSTAITVFVVEALALAGAFALVAVALARAPLSRRLFRHPVQRQATLLAFVPVMAGIPWLSTLLKNRELLWAWPAWILLNLALATLVGAALARRRRSNGQGARSFGLRAVLGSGIVLGSLATIHATAGIALEKLHPYRYPALLAASGLLASLLVLGVMPSRGREGTGRPGLRPARRGFVGGFAVLSLLTVVCDQPREGRPWDGLPASPSTARDPRPNVVLVSIDTLRADHVGAYGYHRDTTPNLDRLAEAGVLFRRNISTAPWTLPSHSALFTSRYPGDLKNYEVKDSLPLARILQSQGYRTVAFTAGRFVDEGYFGTGFDVYSDDGEEEYRYGFSPLALWTALVGRRALNHVGLGLPLLNGCNAWREVAFGRFDSFAGPERSSENAAAFIRQHDERQPFFLFFHTFMAHDYYLATDEMQDEADRWLPEYSGWLRGGNLLYYGAAMPMPGEDLDRLIALYDGAIRLSDRAVGEILAALDEKGLSDDTLVILTSDHGEGFAPQVGRTWHRNRLHNDLLHVPLVVRWPGRLPAGQSIDRPVSAVDVLPTVLELLDLEAPPKLRGSSLLPLIEAPDGAPPFRRFAYSQRAEFTPGSRGSSLHGERFKYIQTLVAGEELYDVTRDPAERRDLEEEDDTLEVLDEFRDRIDAFEASLTAGESEMDAETLEMLNRLGYLQGLESPDDDR